MKATIHHCSWLNDDSILTFTEEVNLPKENRLEYLQKKVGGLIDIYHHNGRDWVLNDEGLLLNLPPNPFASRHGSHLAGTIIEIHGVLN